jgi:pyruvate ferredoxin oxidoreductase gamma subunit
MFQIRIHGRGGQGVVTAAEILSIAAFKDGKYAQAFPSFGSERMGAPVMAFCRINEKEIRLREPVMQPDALIIQDPILLHQVELFAGLKPAGYVLINSTQSLEQLGIGEFLSALPEGHVWTIPATDIAMKYVGRPLPNAALIGGFAAMTGQLRLASVQAAIREKFSGSISELNTAAAAEAFAYIESHIKMKAA